MRLIYCIMVFIILAVTFPFSAFAADQDVKGLDSESAILIDAKTGEVLYQKNDREKMYPASITKIVTGIMAIESGRMDELAVTSKKARMVEGTRVYLAENEQRTIHDLVYGLLMNSGNDAAIVIAEHLAGSVENFANQMNGFVWKTIHSRDTHFTNPHGLFDPDHYTTAYDMAMLARYAMQNPTFRAIVSTKKLPWHGKEWDTTIVNHNKLLWRYDGATGIKNGFVDQSLNTLVTSAKRGGTEFIAVCLKAHGNEKAYADATALLDYGFAHFQTERIISKGKVLTGSDHKTYRAYHDVYMTVSKNQVPAIWVNDSGDLVAKQGDKEKVFPSIMSLETKENIGSTPRNTKVFSWFTPANLLFGVLGFGALGIYLWRKIESVQTDK